jgi:hypothetical protein
MGAMPEIQDKQGRPVAVGDMVKVLGVSPGPDLEDDEREMIEFMIGSICEVERIDAAGRAWVSMWWSCGDGSAATSVGLAANEMEKVAVGLGRKG